MTADFYYKRYSIMIVLIALVGQASTHFPQLVQSLVFEIFTLIRLRKAGKKSAKTAF